MIKEVDYFIEYQNALKEFIKVADSYIDTLQKISKVKKGCSNE